MEELDNTFINKHVNISRLFNKKYKFKKLSSWLLPGQVFKSGKWELSIMQEKKVKLNGVKSRLNQYNLEEWSRHTKYNDPASFVIRSLRDRIGPELLTQAWCKFYECLCQFPIFPDTKYMTGVDVFKSLHLCEAPGAFICALNHYLNDSYTYYNWEWMASTLNPDYEGNSLQEMIPDDRLYRFTQDKWNFGLDGSGDITKYYNYINMVKKNEEKVWLVTADGSINCMMDPGNQERHVEFLHYCETITALSVLQEGGTFVLKIFTSFEDTTVCLLYLLTCCFENVTIFKPCTSKGGNSEVYVICTGYNGLSKIEQIWDDLHIPYQNGSFNKEKSMFHLEELPESFLTSVEACADFFMNFQIETIENNINNFKKKSALQSSFVHHTKLRVANFYLKKYKIRLLPIQYRVVPYVDVNNNFYEIPENSQLVTCYNIPAILTCNLNIQIIDVKYGKKFDIISHSSFCTNNANIDLNSFLNNNRTQLSLFSEASKRLNDSYLIVNVKTFSSTTYSEFQREFYIKLMNQISNKNIIIMGIPLVTNFLAGIFFLIALGFKKLYLHLSGALILSDPDPSHMKAVRKYFGIIERHYISPPTDLPFSYNIIQVVPSNLIHHNQFYDIICNYNNFVLSKSIHS